MATRLKAIVPNTMSNSDEVDRNHTAENIVGVEADKESEEIHLAPLPS